MTASETELAAMRRAAQPVYTELEADPETKSAITAIRALAGRFGRAPASTSCAKAPPIDAPTGSALVPDGTYTAVATKADALRLGVQDECALRDDGNHLRLELKNGEYVQWQGCSIVPEEVGSQGRFTVTTDTFTTIETCCGEGYLDWTFDGRFLTLKVRARESGGPLEAAGQLIMDHRWEKVG